jgi:hypothetical protein
MSGSSHNPRFGVVILQSGQATQQEHHCTQAILDRHGHSAAVFQFPDYQALFDAASAEQLDAVICDSRAATERERTFMHLLGAVLWYRYGLCLHHLDAPETSSIDPVYSQLLTRVLLAAYGDPECGLLQLQPLGYGLIADHQQVIPEQSEEIIHLVRRYSTDEE